MRNDLQVIASLVSIACAAHQRSVIEQQLRSGVVVRISARIMNWPTVCASCCQRPDTSWRIEHTRVRGVRVIRTQTKAFVVPYCTACQRYGQLCDQVEAARDELDRRRDRLEAALREIRAVERFARGELPPMPTGYVAAFVVISLVTCGLGLATWPLFLHQHREECRERIAELPALRAGRDRQESRINEQRATVARLRAERDALVPPVGSPGIVYGQPAYYMGWDGSIHTFVFCNPAYALLFQAVNAGKILR